MSVGEGEVMDQKCQEFSLLDHRSELEESYHCDSLCNRSDDGESGSYGDCTRWFFVTVVQQGQIIHYKKRYLKSGFVPK